MTGSTKLEKKLLKKTPLRFSALTTLVLGKKKTCKNFPIKNFISPSNLTKLNTRPLTLFHGQNL